MRPLGNVSRPSLVIAAVLWACLGAFGEIPQARATPSDLLRQEPEPEWKQEVHPTASIEFPSATVGGKPVHVEMRLKRRC